MREVGYPKAVGSDGREVTINEVPGAIRLAIGIQGAAALAPDRALNACLGHQPLDRAASHIDVFAA